MIHVDSRKRPRDTDVHCRTLQNQKREQGVQQVEDKEEEEDKEQSLENSHKRRLIMALPQPTENQYYDERDAAFDACNLLRRDIATLKTHKERIAMLRSRMSQCILVFAYATHPNLDFGPLTRRFDLLNNAKSLDTFRDRPPDPPPSLFLYLDLLQDKSCEIEKTEAIRDLSAWLYTHPDHSDWLRVILDGNKWSLYKLFAPYLTYYAFGSALRWYQAQQQQNL